MVGIAATDAARDDQLRDVNALGPKGVMQHLPIGALSGESHRGTRDSAVRTYGAASVDEEDRAASQLPQHRQEVLDSGDRPKHGLLDRAEEVLRGRLKNRLHELLCGHRTVLEDLDRTKIAGRCV